MNFNYINDLDFKFEHYPFKHTVLDNFIKEEYIEPLLEHLNTLTIDKSYYHGNDLIEKNKYAFKDNFTGELKGLFEELNGEKFINLLEQKFEINDIIKNNLNLRGAGVHKIFNEGFLCMHSDFEGYIDPIHGMLDRRLNLLLYMNKDWKYNGELCLSLNDKIVKKIPPILNRCVIFVTPDNIHGHPEPLKIPNNICRQSITTYYYTKNTTGKNLNSKIIKPVIWYPNIF